MTVELENNAKRVFDVDHAVRLLIGEVLVDGHALFPTSSSDFLK